ncbi:dioxygenase [Pararhodobacter marinus]|nr:dioxygenase [Pararhodobacter marinus]
MRNPAMPPAMAEAGLSPLEAFGARIEAGARQGDAPNARLVAAMLSVTGHMQAVLDELRPDLDELRALVGFLTEVGYFTDSRRQEWVLLADALGLSAAIEDINAPRPQGATPNTPAGPFYRADAPDVPLGGSLCLDGKGESLRVTGQVRALAGTPLAGARVEVWHANDQGLYENQEPDQQPEFNLRGKLTADPQGRFAFHTIRPAGYALPGDGPVAMLLTRLGLSLDRPAHLHFRVSAPGYQTLTTQIFDRADPAIGRDAVFGVKPELLAEFRAHPSKDGARTHSLDLNLVLCPLDKRDSGPVGGA